MSCASKKGLEMSKPFPCAPQTWKEYRTGKDILQFCIFVRDIMSARNIWSDIRSFSLDITLWLLPGVITGNAGNAGNHRISSTLSHITTSQGESWGDLEMFYIVDFFSVLVNIDPWGSIYAGCQFFYPLALFWEAVNVTSSSRFSLWKVKNWRFSNKVILYTVGKEISSRVKVSLEHMSENEVEKRYGP